MADVAAVGDGKVRHFVARCDCGHDFDGTPSKALLTVLVGFATGHLRLDDHDPAIVDLKNWKMAQPNPAQSEGH